MEEHEKHHRFNHHERLIFRINVILLSVSVIGVIIGYLILKGMIALPGWFLTGFEWFMYVLLAFVVFLFVRVLAYVWHGAEFRQSTSIRKTLASIPLGFISWLLFYVALLFMSLSSCGG